MFKIFTGGLKVWPNGIGVTLKTLAGEWYLFQPSNESQPWIARWYAEGERENDFGGAGATPNDAMARSVFCR